MSMTMKPHEALDYLIRELIAENKQYGRLKIPDDLSEKRQLLRSLMNLREPRPISTAFLAVQDDFLQDEVKNKGIISPSALETVNQQRTQHSLQPLPFGDILSIWQGDITRLAVSAIVNAANNQLLGCFIPGHNCIDNVIHSCAGLQLREACYKLVQEQQVPEPTGQAKITPGFNLPSQFVLHTVGPIVTDGLTPELEANLASCYRSCLKLAVVNQVRSLAFCCISTGVFHFPNQRAAEIAVATVTEFLKTHEHAFVRIIFNVYQDEDLTIYRHLLCPQTP